MDAEPEGHEKKGYPRRYTDVCTYDIQEHGSFVVCSASSVGKTFVPDTYVSGKTIQHGAPPSLFSSGDVTKLEKMSHFQRPLREGERGMPLVFGLTRCVNRCLS